MTRPAASLALLSAVLCAAAAGCGGGSDKKDADKTVREFVKAVDGHDAKRFCNDLVSDSFLEGAFGTKGESGKKQCESQVQALKGVSLDLMAIRKTEIDGNKAKVTAELDSGGRRQKQVLPLVKQDDGWRVSTIGPGGP